MKAAIGGWKTWKAEFQDRTTGGRSRRWPRSDRYLARLSADFPAVTARWFRVLFTRRPRRPVDAGGGGGDALAALCASPTPRGRRRYVTRRFPPQPAKFSAVARRTHRPPRPHPRLDGQDGQQRQGCLGRAARQVARCCGSATRPPARTSSRSGVRPRSGMRQAQPGGGGGGQLPD